MTPTSPAVDLVDLEMLLAVVQYLGNRALPNWPTPHEWVTMAAFDSTMAAEGYAARCNAENGSVWEYRAIEIPVALISELTELRASRSLMEEAVRVIERSAEGWANVIELRLIPPQHVPAATILRDEAQSALTAIKEKTT